MNSFETWLAKSPTASFLKIAVAAALGALGSYMATAEMHPLVVALSAAVLPVVINWLNRDDSRYGLQPKTYDKFDVFGEDDDLL